MKGESTARDEGSLPAFHLGSFVVSDVAEEKFCWPMETAAKYCPDSCSSASRSVSFTRPYLPSMSSRNQALSEASDSRWAGGGVR